MRLLSLEEAAGMLGYTPKGLRNIVNRSRAKANGGRVYGSTIRFFQTSKGSAIKFKPEWIEQFIADHTVNPVDGQPDELGASRRRPQCDLLDV